jgi:hypothetical protein
MRCTMQFSSATFCILLLLNQAIMKQYPENRACL